MEELSEGKRKLAIQMLLRGKSREEIANKLSITPAEVFRIEEAYYRDTEQLDEHALLLKQMRRMEIILDALWDQIVDRENGVAMDPDDLKGALALIAEMNDLLGLKTTKVQAEVKVIQEQQTQLIFAYVQEVLRVYTEHLTQYLTAKGKRELPERQQAWIMDATQQPIKMLDATAEIVV